mmetsp:Transcript_30068/g.75697  ORF Transcript_30068/g.75697 Transcript_30068/m.75697 type:complete len:758 (-) Transcript_30068:31-2304(-)
MKAPANDSIKVEFPPGLISVKHRFFPIKPVITTQFISELIAQNELPNDEYLLFLCPSPRNPPRWLEAEKSLTQYNLTSQDTLKLHRRYQLVKLTYVPESGDIATTDVLFDYLCTVQGWLPYLGRRMKLPDILERWSLFVYGHLNPLKEQMSLVEQDVPGGAQLLLKINPDQKKPTAMDSLPPQDLSAKDIKDPDIMSFLDVLSKTKKWETLFLVLKKRTLYFYRAQTDDRPKCKITLPPYKLRIPDEKRAQKVRKEDKVHFELLTDEEVSPLLQNVYSIRAPSDSLMSDWIDAIRVALGEKAPNSARRRKGPIFGKPLSEAVSVHDGSEVPAVIDVCINYIERRALQAEGIFRLSGSALNITEYKAKFDRGEEPDLEAESDPHCIAGLLKLYFRELPEPVLTFELYDEFMSADSTEDKQLRLKYMRFLIRKLPKVNYAVTKKLMAFLRQVKEHSAVNKMAVHNLATVFGPNLLAAGDKNMMRMVEDTAQVNSIVNTLIQDYSFLFDKKPLPARKTGDVAAPLVKALYEYTGSAPDDLPFKQNDVIAVVLQGPPDGWWKGETGGKFGKFPGSYTTPLSKEEAAEHEEKERNSSLLEEATERVESLQSSVQALREELDSVNRIHKELQERKMRVENGEEIFKSRMGTVLETPGFEGLKDKTLSFYDRLDGYKKTRMVLAESKHLCLSEISAFTAIANAAGLDKKRSKDKKLEKLNESLNKAIESIKMKFRAEEEARKRLAEHRDSLMPEITNFRNSITL